MKDDHFSRVLVAHYDCLAYLTYNRSIARISPRGRFVLDEFANRVFVVPKKMLFSSKN
jgi:hypothetical protein